MENLHQQPNRKPFFSRLGALAARVGRAFTKPGQPDSQYAIGEEHGVGSVWPAGQPSWGLTEHEADVLVWGDRNWMGEGVGVRSMDDLPPIVEPSREQ